MKTIISISICLALVLTLCSCAQSQVNTDRLLDGRADVPSETTVSNSVGVANGEEDSIAKDSTNNIEIGPTEEDAEEIDGNVFEENFLGYGQVNYVINDVRLVDNLTSVGIEKDKLSSNDTYDYYITVSLTVENVDVPTDDKENADTPGNSALINVFRLYRSGENSMMYEPVYFDKGGIANTDARRYFEYALPAIGETLDVTIGFGLTSAEFSALEESTLYLIYTLDTGEMMEINI